MPTDVTALLIETIVGGPPTSVSAALVETIVGQPPTTVTAMLIETVVATDIDSTHVHSLLIETIVSMNNTEVVVRQETQQWDKIRATLEIVDPLTGVGSTGLSPTVKVFRRSSANWLQAGGTTWGATPASFTLTEINATHAPGAYQYELDPAAIDLELGNEGYLFAIAEATTPKRQNVDVQVDTPKIVWDAEVENHLTANTLGDAVFRMLGLRQANTRVIATSWNALRAPTAGSVYVYTTKAALLADTAPWAGAAAKYTFAATYDADLQLTSYTSTKEA